MHVNGLKKLRNSNDFVVLKNKYRCFLLKKEPQQTLRLLIEINYIGIIDFSIALLK